MQVTINGSSKEIPDGATVTELVRQLGIEGPVAVEVNRQIVPRAQHASHALAQGDAIEIVHFVGGG